MFERKVTILLVIISLGTILGFIVGIAPGYFLQSYALFGIGAGFLLFMIILFIVTAILYEYLNQYQIFSRHWKIFHQSLSQKEKILLILINLVLFFGGALLGILCELLFKAINASLAARLITTAIFILALIILLVLILLIALKSSKKSQMYILESSPIIIESNDKPSQELTKPQDGPKNTASRANRSRLYPVNDSSLPTPSYDHSRTYSNNSRPSSTIQREYQRLLQPSARFSVNDRVYVNDHDIGQIIEADGLGNYRIQYLDNGLMDFKNGTELRKALPLID